MRPGRVPFLARGVHHLAVLLENLFGIWNMAMKVPPFGSSGVPRAADARRIRPPSLRCRIGASLSPANLQHISLLDQHMLVVGRTAPAPCASAWWRPALGIEQQRLHLAAGNRIFCHGISLVRTTFDNRSTGSEFWVFGLTFMTVLRMTRSYTRRCNAASRELDVSLWTMRRTVRFPTRRSLVFLRFMVLARCPAASVCRRCLVLEPVLMMPLSRPTISGACRR